MKKLISLALVLCMACLLIPAMAEGGIEGTWYLKEGSVNGMTLPAAQLGMSMTFTFNADGSFETVAAYGSESETATGTWTLEGTDVAMTSEGSTVHGSFADGVFSFEQEGATMTFSQEAPETIPAATTTVAAASEEAFFGTWKLSSMEIMGQTVPAELISSLGMDMSVTLTVEAGKATLAATFNGETQEQSAATEFKDGKLSLVENGVEALTIGLTESGEMAFELPLGDSPVRVTLAPVAEEVPAA